MSRARILKFAKEWRKSHSHDMVYGLHHGDEDREASLNLSDIEAVVRDRDELLEVLKALIPFVEMAFNAEGDTFGVHHNDANDALTRAEALVAKAEGRA